LGDESFAEDAVRDQDEEADDAGGVGRVERRAADGGTEGRGGRRAADVSGDAKEVEAQAEAVGGGGGGQNPVEPLNGVCEDHGTSSAEGIGGAPPVPRRPCQGMRQRERI
jgi:hypothetical protein